MQVLILSLIPTPVFYIMIAPFAVIIGFAVLKIYQMIFDQKSEDVKIDSSSKSDEVYYALVIGYLILILLDGFIHFSD